MTIFRPHPVICSSPECSVCRQASDGPCYRIRPFKTACGKTILDENGRPKKVEPIIYTYSPSRVGCPECLEHIVELLEA